MVRRQGARTGDIRTVVRWARAKGLTARPGGLRTRVVVRGPAGRISQAFGVRLHHYRASGGGHTSLPRCGSACRARSQAPLRASLVSTMCHPQGIWASERLSG
ncbi:MAG: protease pro-enzyme activation domain-containing protein [Miltoncostaeaceae bacterium]